MRVPDSPSEEVSRWSAVDKYFADELVRPDAALNAALQNNREAGLPHHDVSPTQGKMLALFVTILNASRVLEIGTLGGYSTVWMARALPKSGTIVTIESNQSHATVARQNLERTGVADRVEMHVGAALDILPQLEGAFDLIFIDADKPNNANYIRWALKLSRSGTVIVADNVVRGGSVINAGSQDPSVCGVRNLVDIIAGEPRLQATAIQTVGEKGWDGFILALVVSA
jgi:predicted O-methyltransferase YrrM